MIVDWEGYIEHTKCKFCKKELEEKPKNIDTKIIGFCDKDCLDQYCDDYVRDNWRDYCAMMGVTVRE